MNYWNPICLIICAAMVILTILTLPLIYTGTDERSTLGMFCLSILFAGEIICTILFASVYMDRRVSLATFFFMCLISMEYLYLCMEIIHWDAKEIYQNTLVLDIVHHAEHMVLPAMLFLFIDYQLIILKFPAEPKRRVQTFLTAMIMAELILVLINIPTCILFSMDNLEVSNGSLRFLLFIPPSAMAALSAWITLRFSPDRRHLMTLGSCLLIPVIVALLSYPLHIPSFTAISILAVFMLLYGGIYVDRGTRIAEYEADIMEQKVSLMVSRIEPEFLDESLDSIMRMNGNPPETVGAIGEFRKYLKENVNTISQKTPIPFETELTHVESYVRLEKLRFKERLEVVFDIEDRDFTIPAMTLQMIVENAIKHGISLKEGGGTVTISTRETAEAHEITVTDDGIGFDVNAPSSDDGPHIGMRNISSRLGSMMGGTFSVTSEIGKGTVAKVTVPKK